MSNITKVATLRLAIEIDVPLSEWKIVYDKLEKDLGDMTEEEAMEIVSQDLLKEHYQVDEEVDEEGFAVRGYMLDYNIPK